MTTLIAVYNSGGLVGRCDARCYDGVEDRCACICGGRNHGAGRAVAADQTRELAEQWVERARRHDPAIVRHELALTVQQTSLFDVSEIHDMPPEVPA